VAEGDKTRLETDQKRGRTSQDLRALIEAERTGLAFVYWRDSSGEQHILMLSPVRARLTVGRGEHSDIALTWEPTVSRAHAVIESIGDDWTLLDNGISQNGSFVNESLVHGRCRLNDKDRMSFGDTHVVFRDPEGERGSSRSARGAEAAKGIRLTATKRTILIELCRPIAEHRSPTPATDPQIASEVSLTVDTVDGHLRELFALFGLVALPENERRGRLVATVLRRGLLSPGDF